MFSISNHIESIKIIKTIHHDTIFHFKLYIMNNHFEELVLPNIFVFKIHNDIAKLSLIYDDREDCNNIYEKICSQSRDLSDFLYCNIIFAIEYIRHNYPNCKKITTKYWSIDILNIIKTTVIFSETTPGPIHGASEIEN